MTIDQRRANFLIIALDFSDFNLASSLVTLLGERVNYYKVGLELFFAVGEKILFWLKEKNKKIFLDLKLNDIPTTIEKATLVLRRYAPDMLSVFGEGATVKAARVGINPECKVLNVTVLTSTAPSQAVEELVWQRAWLTQANGGDGIVCSAQETASLRQKLGNDLIIVNPGIRPKGSELKDQSRVMTPAAAWQAGASHIVVGRPITAAADPIKATETILAEFF